MTPRDWTINAVWSWAALASGAFAVVYGFDLLRRHRRGTRPTPLAIYIVVLNAGICAIVTAALVDRILGIDLLNFRIAVMATVASAVTYGLTLLLRYRRH